MPPQRCCAVENPCPSPYLPSTPPDIYFNGYEPASEWLIHPDNPCCWYKIYNYPSPSYASFYPKDLGDFEVEWSLKKVFVQHRASRNRLGIFQASLTEDDVCWKEVGEIGTYQDHVHVIQENRAGAAYLPIRIIVRYSLKTIEGVPTHCFELEHTYKVALIIQGRQRFIREQTFTMSNQSCFLPSSADTESSQDIWINNSYEDEIPASVLASIGVTKKCLTRCFTELPSSITFNEDHEREEYVSDQCTCFSTYLGPGCWEVNIQNTLPFQLVNSLIPPVETTQAVSMCDAFFLCDSTRDVTYQWRNCTTNALTTVTTPGYDCPVINYPTIVNGPNPGPGPANNAIGVFDGVQHYLIHPEIPAIFNNRVSGGGGNWVLNFFGYFRMSTFEGANTIANCNTEQQACGVDYMGNPLLFEWGGSFYRGGYITDFLWEKRINIRSDQSVCFFPPEIIGILE